MRVPIVGVAALSRFGVGWRGLGGTLFGGEDQPGLPDEIRDPSNELAHKSLAKARKMMSRGAYLAARCVRDLVRDATWSLDSTRSATVRSADGGAASSSNGGPGSGIGYFLGVGASGGSLADVVSLLDASIVDGTFSLERFGNRGLAACNPLLAFQLMNNFTLCHGAIQERLDGPNAAMFSRGAGTTAALIEAVQAIADGDCEHAIAGGADSALHPVTRAELARDGFIEQGMDPAEGAAMLALGAGTPLGFVTGCAIANGHGRPLVETIADAAARAGVATHDHVELLVGAPWGFPAWQATCAWARRAQDTSISLHQMVWADASLTLGDALAASPAIAWAAALDQLIVKQWCRALVVGVGVDGDVGAVMIERNRGDA